jgi:hypothetical protein
MRTSTVVVTVLAAFLAGSAAVTYLAGHEYPRAQLDMKRLPRSWAPVLGSLLAAGSLGLLAGLVVPWLGIAAGAGLVLYFAGAIAAHLRVGSRSLAGPVVFFVTVVAALVLALADGGVPS